MKQTLKKKNPLLISVRSEAKQQYKIVHKKHTHSHDYTTNDMNKHGSENRTNTDLLQANLLLSRKFTPLKHTRTHTHFAVHLG